MWRLTTMGREQNRKCSGRESQTGRRILEAARRLANPSLPYQVLREEITWETMAAARPSPHGPRVCVREGDGRLCEWFAQWVEGVEQTWQPEGQQEGHERGRSLSSFHSSLPRKTGISVPLMFSVTGHTMGACTGLGSNQPVAAQNDPPCLLGCFVCVCVE